MTILFGSESPPTWIFFHQLETQISFLETDSYNLAKILYRQDNTGTSYIIAAAFDIYRVTGDVLFTEELIRYARAWENVAEPLKLQITQMLAVARLEYEVVTGNEITGFIQLCRKYSLRVELDLAVLNKKTIIFRIPPALLLLL